MFYTDIFQKESPEDNILGEIRPLQFIPVYGLFYLTKLSILSLIYVSYIVLATEAKLTAMLFPGSSLILSYT